jgi:hypothetical protein
MPLSSRKEVKKFVHKKLMFRLRRLAIFFVIVVGIIIYELITFKVAALIPISGFCIGIILGILINQRMHRISWDADATKAVTKMDKLGIFILVVYLLFAIFRTWIFSHWLQGSTLTVFSLSVAAGGILGRLYSTRKKIRDILKDEGVLYARK